MASWSASKAAMCTQATQTPPPFPPEQWPLPTLTFIVECGPWSDDVVDTTGCDGGPHLRRAYWQTRTELACHARRQPRSPSAQHREHDFAIIVFQGTVGGDGKGSFPRGSTRSCTHTTSDQTCSVLWRIPRRVCPRCDELPVAVPLPPACVTFRR